MVFVIHYSNASVVDHRSYKMDFRSTILVLFLAKVCLVASKCGEVFVNQVSGPEAEIIVNKHNALRKLVANGKLEGQPRGVDLKKIAYDKGLAVPAQKIADSCVFAHQDVTDERWDGVGQNLFLLESSVPINGSDWDTAIQSWFDEHKDYTFGACCKSGSKVTGHYTQVVWANTAFVGCGYTYSNTDGVFRKLYVCNYGPAGNYVGDLPYKVGESGCEDLC